MFTGKTAALVIFFFLHVCIAECQTPYLKTFGTSASEYGTSLCATADSGIVFSHVVSDASGVNVKYAVSRVNKFGQLQWSTVFSAYDLNVPEKIIPFGTGFLVAGTSWQSGSNQHVAVMARLDESGNILWIKEYSVTGSELVISLAASNDRFYLLATGDYNIGSVYPHIVLFSTDTTGGVMWSKRIYALPYMLSPACMSVSPSGKICIGGTSNSFGTSFIFEHMVITQMDSLGNMEWVRVVSTTYDDRPVAIQPVGSDWIIAGTSAFPPTAWDFFIGRIDDGGTLQQMQFYDAGTSYGEAARDMIIDGSHILVAGEKGTFDERNIFLVKTDLNGNIVWSKEYPVSPLFTNYPYEVISAPEGNGYAFISDLRPPAYLRDAGLFRVDSLGELGCYTQPVQFAVRTDSVHVLDTVLTEVPSFVTETPLAVQLSPDQVIGKPVCEIPFISFTHAGDTICPEYCIQVTDHSEHVDTWLWSFPGGQPSSFNGKFPPQVCYADSGSYDIILVAGNSLSFDTVIQTISIGEICPPLADFTFEGDTVCPLYCYSFTNLSSNTTFYEWTFDGGVPSFYNGHTPGQVCYDSAGVYTVTLITRTGTDTLSVSRNITIEPLCEEITIPNVITPDGNNLNDQFVIKNLPDNFRLKIFNRWGNELFETTQRGNWWSGETAGVYFYTLEVYYPDRTRLFNGTVTVLK